MSAKCSLVIAAADCFGASTARTQAAASKLFAIARHVCCARWTQFDTVTFGRYPTCGQPAPGAVHLPKLGQYECPSAHSTLLGSAIYDMYETNFVDVRSF